VTIAQPLRLSRKMHLWCTLVYIYVDKSYWHLSKFCANIYIHISRFEMAWYNYETIGWL